MIGTVLFNTQSSLAFFNDTCISFAKLYYTFFLAPIENKVGQRSTKQVTAPWRSDAWTQPMLQHSSATSTNASLQTWTCHSLGLAAVAPVGVPHYKGKLRLSETICGGHCPGDAGSYSFKTGPAISTAWMAAASHRLTLPEAAPGRQTGNTTLAMGAECVPTPLQHHKGAKQATLASQHITLTGSSKGAAG